jgi:hypothetical protein
MVCCRMRFEQTVRFIVHRKHQRGKIPLCAHSVREIVRSALFVHINRIIFNEVIDGSN